MSEVLTTGESNNRKRKQQEYWMGVEIAATLTGPEWPRHWQQQSCSSHWERIWSPQNPWSERGKKRKGGGSHENSGEGAEKLRKYYCDYCTRPQWPQDPAVWQHMGYRAHKFIFSEPSQNIRNELMPAFPRMLLPLRWCFGDPLKVRRSRCTSLFVTVLRCHGKGSKVPNSRLPCADLTQWREGLGT